MSVDRSERRWRGAWRYVIRFVRGVFLSVGILTILIVTTPVVPWWARKLAGSFDDSRGNSLLVLASADSSDGILSYGSYLRSEYVIRAWREGWVQQILISGNSLSGEPVAQTMAEFIEAQGVPKNIIRLETSSKSTRENALFSKGMISELPAPVVLLTSDYHMYRARRCFEKLGIAVKPRPFPDSLKRSNSPIGRLQAFWDLCRESGKIGYYKVRGWI